MTNLESPASKEALYVARGEETGLFDSRPRFTGDVLQQGDELGLILQHPCAIRRGVSLVDRLLMAKVEPFNGSIPPDWSTGHYKKFFLPDLLTADEHYAANFAEPLVWTSASALGSTRRAILSAHGVNLLLQRWVHHSTRVCVPSATLNAVTAGPYEEADLVGDTCSDIVAAGGSAAKAEVLLDAWLSDGHASGSTRRDALDDAQQRASIRQQARAQSRIWIDDRAAHT